MAHPTSHRGPARFLRQAPRMATPHPGCKQSGFVIKRRGAQLAPCRTPAPAGSRFGSKFDVPQAQSGGECRLGAPKRPSPTVCPDHRSSPEGDIQLITHGSRHNGLTQPSPWMGYCRISPSQKPCQDQHNDWCKESGQATRIESASPLSAWNTDPAFRSLVGSMDLGDRSPPRDHGLVLSRRPVVLLSPPSESWCSRNPGLVLAGVRCRRSASRTT